MSSATVILIVRLLITLTFLILAVGGPVAIIMLRRFIRVYLVRHAELILRIEEVEKRLLRLEQREASTPPYIQRTGQMEEGHDSI